MKTGRQTSVRAPSVRTSSSHRSTIETRGVPEFDRDYARQLSVAKRGRTGSVKASPRVRSVKESPLEESIIGHFPGSAAAAATRIKDYVATHVTPPRPFQSNTPHRPNDSISGAGYAASNGAGTPSSVAPPRAGAPGKSTSTSLFGVLGSSANDGDAGGTTSPPDMDSLNSTRCGSAALPSGSPKCDATHDSIGVVALKTVVLSVAVFFVLLCALSFFVSSDQDYVPSYFSLGKGPETSAAQHSVGARARSLPDRMIPQLNRQIALHSRRALGHVIRALGFPNAWRFGSRIVRGALRPFTLLWTVVRDCIVCPIVMVLPKVDVSVHPTLRYILAGSTEGAEGWSLSTSGTLLGSIARSSLQLVIEPAFIIWRALCAIWNGFMRSIQLFSVPLTSRNLTLASPLRHNATTPIRAMHRGSHTSVMSRATSSVLLTMWRPLHRIWAIMMSLAVGNATSISESWTTASLNNLTSFSARNTSEAHARSVAKTVAQDNKVASHATEQENATARAPSVLIEVRTTHTRRLPGDLWSSLLAKHEARLTQLAREDLQELLGGEATIDSLQLRAGSLVVDFAVVVTASAPTGQERARKKELQKVAQSERDAQVAQGSFSRLQAFYKEEATRLQHDRDAAATAAAAECDERVTACRHDCDALRARLTEETRACTDATLQAQRTCEANRVAALRETEMALQECRSNTTVCATKLAEAEKLLKMKESEKQRDAAALAAAQQALAAASVGYANESEAERQRCAVKLAEASQNCSSRVHAMQTTLEKERAKELVAKEKDCEAAMLKTGEQRCAVRLAEQNTTLREQCQTSMQHAEALCLERVARTIGEVNRSSASALRELQTTLNARVANATQRLAACEEAHQQAAARWEIEQQKRSAASAAQLTAAQTACEETERRAASDECAKRVASQRAEWEEMCNATVRQAKAACQAQLSRDVAAFNSSAAAELARLRDTVETTKQAADARVAACETLRAVEKEASAATQRRLNVSCAAQLAAAQEKCKAEWEEKLETERTAQRQAALQNWTRQAAVLTTQCSQDTKRAVAEATARLQAQHASALEATTAALQQRAAEEREKEKQAFDRERETTQQHYGEKLRSCEVQVSSCVSERRAAETAHAKAEEDARRHLFAYLADSGEKACLRLTHHDKKGCAAERRKIEATLHVLPATATLLETLSRLDGGAADFSTSSPATSGHLTWDFSGSGLRSLRPQERQGRGVTPWLHITGMAVGLASGAYALFRRQRDRRLYKDTVAQLNAVIAANEKTMARRQGHLDTAAAAVADEAPASWAMAVTCLDECVDAFASWHFKCCELLFEQEANSMLQQRYEVQQSLLTNVSDTTAGNVTAPSLSHGDGHPPPTSVVSASTLPLADANVSCMGSFDALMRMHESFVSTYYNVLEMYYVDLLNAVANRELAESQLQEAESVASRQASILHKQSAAVAQLKHALAEKEALLQQRGPTAGGSSGVVGKLPREERKTAAQQAITTRPEGQRKVSQEEMGRARGVVQTPGRTPHSEPGPESSAANQVRSLQELAAAENDSTNSSDFSNRGHHSPQRPATGVSPSKALSVSRGTPAELQRAAPASAIKKLGSMMRNPESTRRYHTLRWNDESGGE